MTVENQNDIDGILNAGRVVAVVRDTMLSAIEPGMTTAELDRLGSELLDQYGAVSAPRVTYDFPGATCISINEQAAHGIPGDRVIKAGDIQKHRSHRSGRGVDACWTYKQSFCPVRTHHYHYSRCSNCCH